MRNLLKGLGIIPLLLAYLFLTGLIRLVPVNKRTKRIAAITVLSVFARIVLILFGVRVQVKHRERLHKTGNARLVVSNHLSYIDILVLSSVIPSAFITSIELKNTALLGWLARLSGSLFVERRTPTGLKREIEDIVSVLGQGLPVALFPEGTTSNGDRVQPFKNALFDAAILTKADIVPVCVRYLRVNNERLTSGSRDAVFYYGGVTFFKHFFRFLSLKSIDVELVPLEIIKASAGPSRKDLAVTAYEAISAAYIGKEQAASAASSGAPPARSR